MKKDAKISAIRLICTLAIVVLHIFQQIESDVKNLNIATDWLNLGLVMFCCISAFLYSSRNIGDAWKWYKHRYFEIAIPALIVGVITILFFALTGDITISKMGATILSSLGFEAFLNDSWMFIQLWFLTYLLIFYLTLPLLQKINCKCKSEFKFWSVCGATVVFVQGISLIIESIIDIDLLSVGVFLRFYLPYFVFRRYGIESDLLKKIMKLFALLCIPVILIVSYVRYFAQVEGWGEIVFIYGQTFIGFVLFYWLYQAFTGVKVYNKLLILSDKYSYNIYLTHCLFIGYKTSIIKNAPNVFIGIIIALLLTFVSSVTLGFIMKQIKDYLCVKRNPV